MEITLVWSWFSFFAGMFSWFFIIVAAAVFYGFRQRAKAEKWSKDVWKSMPDMGKNKQ